MDLLEAKSRIAEALVESIFRRARYRVDRFHTEQFPLRFGREDFSPDFRASLETGTGEPFELLLEVKYRPHIDQFISVENQRGDRSVFLMVDLTDLPELGIFRNNVEDHEALVGSIFELLNA
jgi:hypothetical protein